MMLRRNGGKLAYGQYGESRVIRRDEIEPGAVLQENLLTNEGCPLRESGDTFIDRRREVERAHGGSINPVVERRDVFRGQRCHAMHGGDDRCGIRRIAGGV